jgi:peptidoglycan/LPS O-acetylase OafA/YrhL
LDRCRFILRVKRLSHYRYFVGHGWEAVVLPKLYCPKNATNLPTYYLCLVLFIVATRLSANAELWNSLKRWGGAGWFAFYLGNFRIAWVNAMPPIFSLTPLWSLQVEEQFYVLFPLVVSLLSIQNLRRMLVGCVIAAPLLRVCLTLFVPGSAEACYVLMPCRMDALALGALLAASSHSRPPLFPNGFFMRLGGAVGGIAILAAAFFGWLDLHSPVRALRRLLND